MTPKERFQKMNMNCKNSRGWLGVGVFLLAALALPACTHRHIRTAGPPAHAPAHGYHRHGIHRVHVVGLRITFYSVGGTVVVLRDGTYVNQHGHYIIISGGYVHELGGIPPGQIVAASRRRGPRHGYPPGHSKVKFKVKKVKLRGGRLSFVGPDGGTVVLPGGIYKNKLGHQVIVDDGRVRTLVLAANEPSRAAAPSTPGAGHPSRADRRPTRGDDRPSRADRRRNRTDERPARADERPSRADRRPTRADERPTRDTGRSDRSNTSSARGDAHPTNAGTSRRPASPAGRASESSERGAAPAGRGTAQSRKPAAEPSKRVSGKKGRKESSEQSKPGSSRDSSKKKPRKESSEQGTSDSSQSDSKKKESEKKK